MTVELGRVPGVELARAGTWQISTGEWHVTPADLAAAVAAHQAGVLRRPVLKVGHVDPRFDGEPAVGHVDNLRTTDGGATLLGDYVGVPAWLADGVLAAAWPDRSVEAIQDYRDPRTGRTWPLVLTAVALLGATAPGMSTLRSLADVGALYGVTAAAAPGARRVVAMQPTPATPADPAAHRRVVVRAAAARRRHRTAVLTVAAIDAATTRKDTPA